MMLRTTVVAAILVAGNWMPAGALAGSNSIVIGQDDPAVDVAAVQQAVNEGGSVELRGTFDFGANGRVLIQQDVRISGQDETVVIKGGFWSFYSPLPAARPPAEPGPDISIRGITFDGALWAPISIAYASGVDVRHNTIRGVRPRFVSATLAIQEGILVGTRWVAGTGIIPGAVTGRLVIEHNEIDMSSTLPLSTLCGGIFVTHTWGVKADIRHNNVSNCSRNSIETLDNSLNAAGEGHINISHNSVVTNTVGVPIPSPSTPNGIVAGWFFDLTGSIDPERNPMHTVSHNYVEALGQTSFGIFVGSDGALVTSNHVVTHKSGTRGILMFSSNGLLRGNEISGVGESAIWVGPFGENPGSNNTLTHNEVSQYQASVADLRLSGNDNLVLHFEGSILDEGTGNECIHCK